MGCEYLFRNESSSGSQWYPHRCGVINYLCTGIINRQFLYGSYVSLLNYCNILCTNAHNAYLNLNPKKKVCFEASEDFGARQGHTIIISRYLYVIKGSGDAWQYSMRDLIQDLGSTPCRTDLDIWMRPYVHPGTNSVSRGGGGPTGDEEGIYQGGLYQGYKYQVAEYYEYLLIRVN